MSFNELKQHGTEDFPYELYKVDSDHPRYKMAMHWHSSIELIRILSGKLKVTLDDKTIDCESGDMLLVNSEVIHGATPENCIYRCLVFNPSFLKTGNDGCNLFLENLLSQECFLFEKITDSQVYQIVCDMMQAMDEQKDGYTFKVIGLSALLFGVMQEKGLFSRDYHTDRDMEKIHKLKRVLKYMRDNYASEISLDDMASVADLSTKYFCSFFKAMTGTTPVKYLLAYRIERSARRLISSDDSITQIAYECGFNDLSYFIKTFKQLKKITPKNYRKK